MNLLFPKLDWVNETAAVKQGASIVLTMLIGMTAALIALGLVVLLSNHLPTEGTLLLPALLIAAAAFVLRLWLNTQGARRFGRPVTKKGSVAELKKLCDRFFCPQR